MILFGGRTPGLQLNDVWSLTPNGTLQWKRIVPRGVPPAPRSWHLAVYDPTRDRMLVLGGVDSTGTLLGDLWALSLGPDPTWEEIVPSGVPLPPLQGDAAVYDPQGDRLLLYGGLGPTGFSDELWVLSLSSVPAWSTMPVAGPTPGPRFFPAMIPDLRRNRLVLYGGADGSTIRSDAWALALDGSRWVPLESSGSAPARYWCLAISDAAHDRMVIHGGITMGGAAPVTMKDTWTLEWGSVVEAPQASPPPLACCASLTLAVDPPHPSVGPVHLRFTLPEPANVRLAIYDVNGRLVRMLLREARPAGGHRVVWDRNGGGSRVRAGVYLCQLVAGSRRMTIRLVLLR
jgi:flagellar hook capping protein FlgD/galactose oxidase-like protein